MNIVGNDKLMGPEITHFDPPLESENDRRLIEVYNWYNYFFDQTQGREWLYEWMEKNGYKDENIERVKKTKAYYTPLHVAANARIALNGNVLPPMMERAIRNNIQTCLLMDLPEDNLPWTIQKQSPAHAKMKEVFAHFEGRLEAFWLSDYKNVPNDDWAAYLKSSGLKPSYCQTLIDEIGAIHTFVSSSDHINAENKKRYLGLIQGILDAISEYQGMGVAKPRKPRQKRAVDPAKAVAKLQHMVMYPPLEIGSVMPVSAIVGASAVFLFSTKYNRLTALYAKNGESLLVKGTTIINFDPKLSMAKVLRKPHEVLKPFLKMGKNDIKPFFDSLTTKYSTPNGRSNADTIILRVIR